MAFLGDLGKVFGLGSSRQVLGDIGGTVGGFFGIEGSGRNIGQRIADATSSLSTADQPLEQSAVPTGDPSRGLAQEGSRSGSQTVNIIDTSRGMPGEPQSAFIGGIPGALQGLSRFTPQISKFFGSPLGSIGTGIATGVGFNMLSGQEMKKPKPVLTQSRRNKARVRQLVNFLGIEGSAEFLSQASGMNVMPGDVVQLLLRTFRNDGAFITKAQVRNLRRTTNRFKSLEKQVKEATSMARSTQRRSPRRSSSTTLIKN